MTALTSVDGDQLARHGTASHYRHSGCRCLLCRMAATRYQRELRAAARERKSRDRGPVGDTSWMARGACADHPTDLWFPLEPSGRHGGNVGRTEAAKAKAVCATCPVVDECATYAIANREEYGVWGGLDEAERRLIRRQGAPS